MTIQSERFLLARRRKNLTQQEVQRLSGLRYAAISQIEKGRTQDMRVSTLLKLAEVYEVSTDYLLGRNGHETY